MSRQSSIVIIFTELIEVDCVSHPTFNLMDIEGTTLSRQLFVWRKMHGTKANLPLVQMKSRQLGLLSSNIDLFNLSPDHAGSESESVMFSSVSLAHRYIYSFSLTCYVLL